MINALVNKGIYDFNSSTRPVLISLLKCISPFTGDFSETVLINKANDAVNNFYNETKEIIKNVVTKNEVMLTGPLELGFVNIYNARFYNNYITTTYFLMYKENNEDKMLPGNYVIKMSDERTIELVYKW